MSASQHSPSVRQLSKEGLVAALTNPDECMGDLQAVLQYHQQPSVDASPFLAHANELLPALLAACDVTSPAGQSRKLASLNTLWKLLLVLTASSALSVESYARSVHFMLGQLWHGVFSHDWTDPRRSKLAAFFASHVLTAVRAHPGRALTCDGGALCASLTELFAALAEAVASGDGDAAVQRARLLHHTVLLRIASAVECLGGAAAAAAAAAAEATGGTLLGEVEEEAAAAGCAEVAAVRLFTNCCGHSTRAGACDSAVAAAVADARASQPSRLAGSTPPLARPPAHTALHPALDRSTAVQAVASLGCCLHAATGLLQQAERVVGVGVGARLDAILYLTLRTLLQWLPPGTAEGAEGAAAMDLSFVETTTAAAHMLWRVLHRAAAALPPSVLWSEPLTLGGEEADEAAAAGAGPAKSPPPSLRTMWVECVSRALRLLMQLAPAGDGLPPAPAPAAPSSLCPRHGLVGELLSALASPHPESVSLLAGCMTCAAAALSHSPGCATQTYVRLLHQLTEVGTVLCAGAQLTGRHGELGRGCDEGGVHGARLAGFSAPLDLATALAVVVGGCCAVLPGQAPSSLLGQLSARSGSLCPPLDHGCFLALADEVWCACEQELVALEGEVGGEEDGGDHAQGCTAGPCQHTSGEVLRLALALDAIMRDVVEGSTVDLAQSARIAAVAPALHRLRVCMEGLGPAESAAAAEVILRHRTPSHGGRRVGTTSPAPSTTPSPAAHTASSFQLVLRSFSSTLSTLTRTLTAAASGGGGAQSGLLVAVAAAALVREAAFFPLEEPQDRVLTACVRRWVDLSFLLVDPGAARAGLGPYVMALARHAAARGLVCFVQHNTDLPMDQLRLPAEAAVALMTLLQPSGREDGEGAQVPVTAATMRAVTTTAATLRERQALWAARLLAAESAQASLAARTAAHGGVSVEGTEGQLRSALAACHEAMRAYLLVDAQGTPHRMKADTAACLQEVLALGRRLDEALAVSMPAAQSPADGSATATESVPDALAGAVAGGPTRRAAKEPRRESGGGGSSRSSSGGDAAIPPLRGGGGVSQAASVSRHSSSVQLLARSQTSVHSHEGGVDCVHVD